MLIPLFLLLLIPTGLAQISISDNDCLDKCEDSILYKKGTWDEKLRQCVYAIEEPCKYGCENDPKISTVPVCKKYPDKPPENATDYEKTIWEMTKDIYDQNKYRIDITVHGTEYSSQQDGLVYLQLLNEDYSPVNDSVCRVSIYFPDGLTKWKNEQDMTYSGEGLYFYGFTTPNTAGVYMVSAYCITPEPNSTIFSASHDFEDNDEAGGDGDWITDWYEEGSVTMPTNNAYEGTRALRLRGGSGQPYTDRSMNTTSDVDRVTVSFWAKAVGLEADDDYYFIFSDSGEVNSSVEEHWTDGDDDNVYRFYTYTFLASDGWNFDDEVWVAFDGDSIDNTGDRLHIDNLNITAQQDSYNVSEYQFIRGSGEIHISNGGLSEGQFVAFWMDVDAGDEFSGLAYGNYSVTSLTYDTRDVDIDINGFDYFYCSDILNFTFWNTSIGDWQEITDYSCSRNSALDLDTLSFTHELSKDEILNLQFTLRNKYWRLMHEYYWVSNGSMSFIDTMCDYYFAVEGLVMDDIPLNESHSNGYYNDTVESWCTHANDAYYYLEQKYNASINMNMSKDNFPANTANFNLFKSNIVEVRRDLYPKFDQYVNPLINFFLSSALYNNEEVDAVTGLPLFDTFGNKSTINIIRRELNQVNTTVNDISLDVDNIRDFQLNELSNNMTEVLIYLDYINSTANRTWTHINIVGNLTDDVYDLVYNLTIGNVSVQADVNWSEGELVLYNITSPVQALTEVVRFQAQDVQVVTTTDTCDDANTLNHHVNTTNCIGDNCFVTEFDSKQTCLYGCTNNMCRPPPYISILVGILIAAVISSLVYWAWRRSG
ncbi:MAG: hypothetical protein DRN81_02040 [Thermoproteota archaeon]|nr:MAG: hypothetical protein DRN81_02040 [Candidatus Korarchaeota archaeon]